MTDEKKVRVFVSYAHDDERHKNDVLSFATMLRSLGIDARLDQWVEGSRKDWSTWAITEIVSADFVLVIASAGYRAAGDGLGNLGTNRGVRSEAAVLRDYLHDDRETWLPRLLPVVLPGHSISEIPRFLQPQVCDHYLVSKISESGIEDLVRVLTQQPRRTLPALGAVPILTQETDSPTTAAGQAAERPTIADSRPRPQVNVSDLVDLLESIPAIVEPDGRQMLLGMLPSEIAAAVPHQSRARLHLFAIVLTCKRYEDGLTDLVNAVAAFDPRPKLKSEMASLISLEL